MCVSFFFSARIFFCASVSLTAAGSHAPVTSRSLRSFVFILIGRRSLAVLASSTIRRFFLRSFAVSAPSRFVRFFPVRCSPIVFDGAKTGL